MSHRLALQQVNRSRMFTHSSKLYIENETGITSHATKSLQGINDSNNHPVSIFHTKREKSCAYGTQTIRKSIEKYSTNRGAALLGTAPSTKSSLFSKLECIFKRTGLTLRNSTSIVLPLTSAILVVVLFKEFFFIELEAIFHLSPQNL